MNNIIIAGTGHRPKHLGGYGECIGNKLESLAFDKLEILKQRVGVSLVISGGALGWDIALAKSALRLDIPLEMHIPCRNYESKWPIKSQLIYKSVLAKSSSIIYLGDRYDYHLLNKRNESMIDKADIILALYKEGLKGGTYNAIKYAESKDKLVINLWEEFR